MKFRIFSFLGISAAVLFSLGGDLSAGSDRLADNNDDLIDDSDRLIEPAIERNDPGTGTGTLDIRADVDAFDEDGGFVTEFSVRVRNGLGEPVTGATVTITNAGFGEVTLLDREGLGHYLAERDAFFEGDFTLSVVSGTDVAEGVVLGGLGIHTITEPTAHSTVKAGQDLIVRWDAPSQARSAEVETRDYGPVLLPDTGAVIIPGVSNPADVKRRIRVFRFNEVDIAGALFGSRMRVEVRQSVDPLIVE